MQKTPFCNVKGRLLKAQLQAFDYQCITKTTKIDSCVYFTLLAIFICKRYSKYSKENVSNTNIKINHSSNIIT